MKGRLEISKQGGLVFCTIASGLSILALVGAGVFLLQSLVGIVSSIVVTNFGSLLEYLMRLVLLPGPLFLLYIILSMLSKSVRNKIDNTVGENIVLDKNEILDAVKNLRANRPRKIRKIRGVK